MNLLGSSAQAAPFIRSWSGSIIVGRPADTLLRESSHFIDMARDLRATMLQWTGIPMSVGVAPTKTLAKVANRTAKKDPASGVICTLLTSAAQEALGWLELTDLWGVATRLSAGRHGHAAHSASVASARPRCGRLSAATGS